jgi:hypothetical protein
MAGETGSGVPSAPAGGLLAATIDRVRESVRRSDGMDALERFGACLSDGMDHVATRCAALGFGGLGGTAWSALLAWEADSRESEIARAVAGGRTVFLVFGDARATRVGLAARTAVMVRAAWGGTAVGVHASELCEALCRPYNDERRALALMARRARTLVIHGVGDTEAEAGAVVALATDRTDQHFATVCTGAASGQSVVSGLQEPLRRAVPGKAISVWCAQ